MPLAPPDNQDSAKGSANGARWTRREGLRCSLAGALGAQAEAYGFPFVVWGTGAVLVNKFGAPTLGGILCFLAGGLSAMTLMIVIGCRRLKFPLPLRASGGATYAAIHVISVMTGVLAGWVMSQFLSGSGAFFGAAFVAVGVFELVLTLELWVGGRSAGRQHGDA